MLKIKHTLSFRVSTKSGMSLRANAVSKTISMEYYCSMLLLTNVMSKVISIEHRLSPFEIACPPMANRNDRDVSFLLRLLRSFLAGAEQVAPSNDGTVYNEGTPHVQRLETF